MKIDPDAPVNMAVFRTEEGDYNVSLFSVEGQLKFKLAQKALKELSDLSDKVMILREALQSLRSDIIDTECHEETLIERERARNKMGQYVGDDPTTPNVNEAFVSSNKKE
jgi:hypothetical protein